MARLTTARTTTVSSSSTSIKHADHTFNAGQRLDISAADAGVWVHASGGTASAGGDNCFYLPKNQAIEYTIRGGVTDLTAIREGSTDAKVTVSYIEA